tara:strand:- start:2199 stop:3431 length:1233 start_codon:yes stop_codon:yes gene_type:complete
MNIHKELFSLGENKLTSDYEHILDLGRQPWGNHILEKDEVGKEPTYPLELVFCNKSELLQLTYFVPKEIMFLEHSYVSGTTKSLAQHFYKLAEENIKQFNLTGLHTVLDIGGNDGTQLEQYKKLGINNLINVESAKNISPLSEKKDIKTLNMFFNEETVRENIIKESVDLVNASGVFFHLEQLDSVIKGINFVLNKEGVFVVQFMYAGSMIDNGNFDTIYHEHLCYYTINSIQKLLNQYNLRLFDATYNNIHSGTIIAKFCKQDSKHVVTDRCLDLIEKDKLYNLKAFKEFGDTIRGKKNNLKNKLKELKSNNKKIYAYGAPVKGNTLLNYMGIDNTLIDKAVEINELKIGKYLPGSHIPIVRESIDDLPDYYLLLSHNFKDEIVSKNKDIIDRGVKFIIPFPEIAIIGK